MNKSKVKNLVSKIKFACLLTCLMTGTACSYEPLTITGSVVDESGNALSDVTVWACYSGSVVVKKGVAFFKTLFVGFAPPL